MSKSEEAQKLLKDISKDWSPSEKTKFLLQFQTQKKYGPEAAKRLRAVLDKIDPTSPNFDQKVLQEKMDLILGKPE